MYLSGGKNYDSKDKRAFGQHKFFIDILSRIYIFYNKLPFYIIDR
jgi:hypothetical protein